MIQRTNDTLCAKINRLSEFYSNEDLDDWTAFLTQRRYDFEVGFTFLDAQVRAEYSATQGKPPQSVYQWMEIYQLFKRKYEYSGKYRK